MVWGGALPKEGQYDAAKQPVEHGRAKPGCLFGVVIADAPQCASRQEIRMKYLIGLYTLLIVPFCVYGYFWGEYAYKGFAYNLGRAFIWPAIVFPVIGQILGVMVLLGLIYFLTMRRS
jgi:hypothetical protein